MAYGVKYHVTHKEEINGTTSTFRLEILEDGFGGSSTEQFAGNDIFQFGYAGASVKKIWDNPVQKGTLELKLLIENDSDLSIITDINSNNERQYQLRLKLDGSVKWTGFVIPDLISYSEGQYPFTATIVAKDLPLLDSEDFETNTAIDYRQYSKLIADLINSVSGLSLPINIYDEITASNLTATDDYFEQAYLDKFQLQDFTSFSEGTWEPITKLEALKEIIPKGFVLRQYNNEWHLLDLAHLAQNSGVVTRYEYDSSGVRTGKTTSLDLTTNVDRNTSFLFGSSTNKPYPGIKKVEHSYNHKTSIQNILFDSTYTVTGDSEGEYKTETLKITDTTGRNLSISGDVEADVSGSSLRSGTAEIVVSIGDYELSFDVETIALDNDDPVDRQVDIAGTESTIVGSFDIDQVGIPAAIDEDTLTVEMRFASVSGETVSEVRWKNMSLTVVNGNMIDNGATRNYRLTQNGDWSINADIGTSIFGQGPDDESNSAIRYLSAGATFETLSGFKHVGSSGTTYEEFIATNVMNLQRNVTGNIDVDLWAFFDPINVLTYNTNNYFLLNGTLTGRGATWNGDAVELNWNTGSDTFKDYFKISESDSGTVIPPSDGSELSVSDLDGRYVNEDDIGSQVQAWDADLDKIAALAPSEDEILIANASGDWSLSTIGGAFDDTYLNEDANLSDLTDVDAAYINLNLHEKLYQQHEINSFFELYYSKADLTDGDEELYLDALRVGSGKIKTNSTLQARNADDNAYQNLHIAGLTATTGTFSSIVKVDGVLNVDANIALDNSSTDISTDTFASGFAGTGLAFLNDGDWSGTVDNLTVRQRLRVYELLINQIRATNGSLVVTSATKTGREDDLGFVPVQQLGGTLDWNSTDPFWTETDQYWYRTYRVYVEENQFVPFLEDDLVLSQRFTGSGVHLVEGTVINVENGSATVTNNSTRRYFDINLTQDSDVPASGMDFVRWGNLTDPDRQGVLYLTADDDDAPYMDVVYGMDSHSKRNASSTVKGRIGRLDGIIDNDFPTLDGNQTNLFGVYIDGGYFNNVEVRGTITILDEDASNSATKTYSDDNLQEAKDYTDTQVASQQGNTIIRSDTEPTTRPDGSSLKEGDLWEDTNATLSDDTRSTWMYDGTNFVEPFTVINGARIATGSVIATSIAATTITTSELNFTPLTSTSGTGDIIATINASNEGINIQGDNITLDGNTTVTSNFEVQGVVIGTLTVDTGVDITNATGDFALNGTDGLLFDTASGFDSLRAIQWQSDSLANELRMYSLLTPSNDFDLNIEDTGDGNGDVNILGMGLTVDNDVSVVGNIIGDIESSNIHVTETTEPGAPGSGGIIFLEGSSGDLKIKFSNGTVKTIATN